MRALERGQQRRVGVGDPAAVGVVDRLVEDRHEAGHRHQVDLVALQRVDDPLGVRTAVEVGAETTPARRPRPARRRASARSTAPHGRSTTSDRDGEARVEQGLENRPAPRSKHPEPPHGSETSRALTPDLRGCLRRQPIRDGLPAAPRTTVAPTSRVVRRNAAWISTSSPPGTRSSAGAGSHLFIFSFFNWLGAKVSQGPIDVSDSKSGWGFTLTLIAILIGIAMVVSGRGQGVRCRPARVGQRDVGPDPARARSGLLRLRPDQAHRRSEPRKQRATSRASRRPVASGSSSD